VLPNLFVSNTQEGQNQNFPFGGTAVLIMVGVGLETVKQIETQLNQRNYEGFLKECASCCLVLPGRARAPRRRSSRPRWACPRSRPATSSGRTSAARPSWVG